MTTELTQLAQEWLAFSLVLAAQLLLILALRRPVRARLGAVACYRLWLLPLFWVPFYALGPALLEMLATSEAVATRASSGYYAALQQIREFELLSISVDVSGSPELSAGGSSAIHGWTLLAIVWACGSLALIAWHGCRWLNFSRHVRALAVRMSAADCQSAGTTQHFVHTPVMRLPGMNSAAIFGVFNPALLLPESFCERYDHSQRHIILAHEAVHLRRGDNGWNLCALLLLALFWTNPLMFIAWRYFRLDQELSCDALALRSCNKEQKRRYARTLLDSLGTMPSGMPAPVMTAWDNLGDIKERSLMVKQHLHAGSRPLTMAFSLLTLAVLGASLTVTFAELVSSTAEAAEAAEPTPQQAQAVAQSEQPTAMVMQPNLAASPLPAQESRQVAQQAAQAHPEIQLAAVEVVQEAAQSARQASQTAQPFAQVQREATQPAQESQQAVQTLARAPRNDKQPATAALESVRAMQPVVQEFAQAVQQARQAALQPQRLATEVQPARPAEQPVQPAAQQEAGQAVQEEPKAARPRRSLGVNTSRDLRDSGVDHQTAVILSDAIDLLDQDRFAETRSRLLDLRLARLNEFERSRYEQLMYNLDLNDKNYAGARAHLVAAIASDGLNKRELLRTRYMVAQLLVQEKKYAEAATALEAWIASAPAPDSAAYYLLASAYYHQSQFDKALPNAQTAVKLTRDGPNERRLSLLASLYIEQKEFVAAASVVTDMIELYPYNQEYRNQLEGLRALIAQR